MTGELLDRLGTVLRGKVGEQVDRQLVVGMLEGVPAVVGRDEDLGGSATAASAVRPALSRRDKAALGQRGEVATHSRLGEGELVRDLGRSRSPSRHDDAQHPAARARLGVVALRHDVDGQLGFHNTILA